MIHDQDRSGWFGASDTAHIMGNWDTKTFALWWLEKMGLRQNNIKTRAMQTGTVYEHRILDALGVVRFDRQIKIWRYRLRVNLDGEDETIHEVKTYGKVFKISPAYWQQAQVEMFAARKPLNIEAYKLMEDDYQNYFNPIIPERLSSYPVKYDPEWIQAEYLPRLEYLAHCLRKGAFPSEYDYNDFRSKDHAGEWMLDQLQAVIYGRFRKSKSVLRRA